MAGAAGLIGVALAPSVARALLWMQPSFGTTILDLSLDIHMLIFGVAISVLTAVGFSLAPAIRLSRTAIEPALKSASWGSTGRKQRTVRWVTAFQIALSVILVTASFLFARSLIGLHTVHAGFDRDHIISATLNPRLAGYRDDAAQARLGERLIERLSALPGVKSASVGLCAVLMGCSRAAVVNVDGRDAQPDDPRIWINPVSTNYFETAGIPLVMGRGFGPGDRPGSTHVAVVTEALARFYFPDQNPLGKRFTERDGGDPVEIVGVLRDVKFVTPRDAPIRMAFLSLTQFPGPFSYVQVKTGGPPERSISAVRRAILEVDPKLFLLGPDPLSDVLDLILSRDVLLSRASSLFGMIALLLACFGLYGVISYIVAARTAELGIRLALGAQPREVLRHVIWDALNIVTPGILLGIAGAWAAGRLVESLLFGIKGRDPMSYVAVAISFLLVSILAASLPGLRASRIDPLRTLRGD
jgi:macrolide transport system ATP-binding/permease protein